MGSGPTVLSLCAGIGGLDLGIGLAFPGARAVCYVERESACIELLAARMAEGRLASAPVWSDLATFDGAAWRGRVDCVAAGYPCQPFSLAGRGLAQADPRHLWPDVARVIDETRAGLVVLENVRGHLQQGFEQVLADLTELGMDAIWCVYPATAAGYPHQRSRLFIVAYTRSGGLESLRGFGLLDRERETPGYDPYRCRESVGTTPPGPDDEWARIPERFWPTIEPPLRGVADGVPARLDQLRALGNAVVPQQAAFALRDLVRRLS